MNWLKQAFDGLMEFLNNAGEAIGTILGFVSVQEAVTELGIAAFVTLLSLICNLVISAACGAMEILGGASVKFFSPDIGSGASSFEVLFGSLDWIFEVFRVLGFALLFFIAISSLVKMTTSPAHTGDTPFGLVTGIVLSGALIYMGPSVVMIAQSLFNKIYTYLFKFFSADFADLNFNIFAFTLQDIANNNLFDLNKADQIQSLVVLVVMMFMLAIIAFKFIGYLYEVAIRYVIMAILVVTSPAAFALSASRNTRASFTKWVRMVASQLLLLIFNVIFLGAFFQAVNSFPAAHNLLSGKATNEFVTVILWCVLIYGCLHVGAKIDSYLCSLGLNVAQTGSVMMVSLFSELIDTGQMYIGKHGRFSIRNSSSAPGEIFQSAVGAAKYGVRAFDRWSETHPKSGKRVIQRGKNGGVDISSVNEAVHTMRAGEKIKDPEVGRAVISSLRGFPPKLTNALEPSACTIRYGGIIFDLPSRGNPKRGARGGPSESTKVEPSPAPSSSIILVPHDTLSSAPGYGPGEDGMILAARSSRNVTIDGVKYMAFASGPQAAEFLTSNRRMDSYMAETYGDRGKDYRIVKEKQNGEVVSTGIYVATETLENGRMVAHEYAPRCRYSPQENKVASLETIGGMEYWHMSSTFAAKDGHIVVQAENPAMPNSTPHSSAWFNDEFPGIKQFPADKNYTPAAQIEMPLPGTSSSCYITQLTRQEADGRISNNLYLVPSACVTLTNKAQIADTVYAKNGAEYYIVQTAHPESAFVPRNETSTYYYQHGFVEHEFPMEEIERILSATELQRTAYQKSKSQKNDGSQKYRQEKESRQDEGKSKKKGGKD